MAILYHWDGSHRTVTPINQDEGFSLAELYALLHCDIVQMIPIDEETEMYLDDEAKLRHPVLPPNKRASEILRLAGGIPGDAIIGFALVCNKGEVK